MKKKNTRIVLQWKNIFSGETGYVRTVSRTNRHFINTFNVNEAKSYRSQKEIDNDMSFLYEIGECIANDFNWVEIAK